MNATIRIVCAYEGEAKAKAIARLLGAEGHVVTIACGRATLDEIDPERDPECVVFVWSQQAEFSPYVTPWVKATDPTYAVELTLTGKQPIFAGRREPPIDFSKWREDRVSDCWKELERRIRRVAQKDAPPRIESTRAAMAFGAVGAVMLVAAVGVRLFDQPSEMAENTPAPVSFETAQMDMTGQGGLSPRARLLEPESADLEPIVRSRAIRARALAASPDNDERLIQAAVVEPMTFRDRNLLDALTSRLRGE